VRYCFWSMVFAACLLGGSAVAAAREIAGDRPAASIGAAPDKGSESAHRASSIPEHHAAGSPAHRVPGSPAHPVPGSPGGLDPGTPTRGGAGRASHASNELAALPPAGGIGRATRFVGRTPAKTASAVALSNTLASGAHASAARPSRPVSGLAALTGTANKPPARHGIYKTALGGPATYDARVLVRR